MIAYIRKPKNDCLQTEKRDQTMYGDIIVATQNIHRRGKKIKQETIEKRRKEKTKGEKRKKRTITKPTNEV